MVNKPVEFLQKLGVKLRPELLQRALSHRSYAFESRHSKAESNERLEFLGDAVLGLAVAEHLYHNFPERTEGELAKIRSAVVCETTLARRAQDLGLGAYLLLGHGEDQSGGRDRPSLLADALEAIIGAIFLEHGYQKAASWVVVLLSGEIRRASQSDGVDYKSRLQEEIQHTYREAPSYEVLSEHGPDHAKFFRVAVKLADKKLGTGEGFSKKEAEQAAARQALCDMGLLE